MLEALADSVSRLEARASVENMAEREAGWETGPDGVLWNVSDVLEVCEGVFTPVLVGDEAIEPDDVKERERDSEAEPVVGEAEEAGVTDKVANPLTTGVKVAVGDTEATSSDAAGEALGKIVSVPSRVLEKNGVWEGEREQQAVGENVAEGEKEGPTREAGGDPVPVGAFVGVPVDAPVMDAKAVPVSRPVVLGDALLVTEVEPLLVAVAVSKFDEEAEGEPDGEKSKLAPLSATE